MKSISILASACVALSMLGACSSKSNIITIPTSQSAADAANHVKLPTNSLNTGPRYHMPKATAFRMTGDYANNVAVTIGPDGNLVYFPDPRDISDDSCPLEIGDGWWLNRQGLSAGSVFTKWTFEEYRNLKSVPSAKEIKEAIIPGAVVSDFRYIPVSINKVKEMTPEQIRNAMKL